MIKLYVVVRADLRPGLQLAQSCHAVRLFTEEHPEADRAWFRDSNNLVCLQAESKEHLAKLAYDATNRCVPVSMFREPDLGGELTAIVIGPAGGRMLGSLPLALRDMAA